MARTPRLKSLSKVPSKSIQATVYRVLARQYPPLSLEGSLTLGGRYNPPLQFGALYCGVNEAICWTEIEKRVEAPVRRGKFKVARIRVRLARVLDLTDSAILAKIGVKADRLILPADYQLTRAIAVAARKAGFEAILAPSSAGPGMILAIFSDRLSAKSTVALVSGKRQRPR